MAPVVQIPVGNDKTVQDKSKKPIEKRSELLCRVKYCNTLPDIPFDPKFIVYPFDTNRFVEYKQTSLEKNYKHDLLTEQDLGVTIDLINPETYEITDYLNSRLCEEDEKLLDDELIAPQDTKRSRCHNKAISWLKKTEYISTEFNRYGASSDKTETKVGFGVKKKMRDENLCLDRDSQIAAINKTFDFALKPIHSHPGKPGVKPVKIWPVYPDFELWKFPFAQVMFDADPASIEKEKEMSQAMIRGVMDESGEQFVAYFLPTEETMHKRKIDELENRDYTEEVEYEYTMAREYNWNVKNKATKGYEENYFFVWRDDAVCYNELETRVKLSKRRVKHSTNNSKLVVKHRQLNDQEHNTQEIRMTQLEPPQDEEEPTANFENANIQITDEINESQDSEPKENAVTEKRKSEESDSESSDNEVEETNKKPIASDESESEEKSSSSDSESSSSESDSEDGKSSSNSSNSEGDDDHQKRTKDIFGDSD